MHNPTQQQIEALAKEKGIDPDIVIAAIEDAVLAASHKYYKSDENLRTKFNSETGQVELFAVRQIVEEVTDPATEISLKEAQDLYGDAAEVDMEIEFPKSTEVLGRIAAQTAKQVIFQKVREAERENIYAEFSDRVGDVVPGTVKRFENGDIYVESGHIEALLPRREQSRAENYTTGDRVRAVIREVNKNVKGPQLILSRTDPVLLIKLFEQEVPGNLRRHGVDPRRRAGSRRSGQGRGVLARARRRSGRRLRRHEGDARAGDHPRTARREDRHRRVVGRPDPVRHQRHQPRPRAARHGGRRDRAGARSDRRGPPALAGDRQEGARTCGLAAKLTGWKIDIKSEEEKRREVEAQLDGLGAGQAGTLILPGLDDEQIRKLHDAGLNTAEELSAATGEQCWKWRGSTRTPPGG